MAFKKIVSEFRKWQEGCLGPLVARRPLRREKFETSSGVELGDLSVLGDGVDSEAGYLEKVGFPGQYPFTRGVQASMYRGRYWTMRQYAGFGTAEETNRRFRYLLEQGTSGLSVAFDLPTQMGFDSDDKLALGEVGRVGVAIDTLDDMASVFEGISLEEVSTSMTINSTAHILLAFYLALAKKQGVSWDKVRGTIQNDVLKEYIARGTYIYPPKPALKIVTDIFEFCKDSVPNWNTISISGYHIREAGSTAVQELAFTLANGMEYVQAAVDRGLKVDDFAPRLAFFFNAHNNFLEEVAKFRAARRMWARIMKERFGARNERSCMLRFHAQTAGSSLTAQEPQSNVVRTTLQALAAVLGGTQSLHTNAYDEAICLPTRETARLALRTQQVIAHESGIADVVDPLGGSYFVENLTDQIEAGAQRYLEQIADYGSMVQAIEASFPQKEIEEAAYRYQKKVETGEQELVGVNIFGEDEDSPTSEQVALKLDPDLEVKQIERLKAVRSRRSKIDVESSLKKLEDAVKNDLNIMPSVCEAVETYATLGEISNLLRRHYGEYQNS